MQIVQSLFVLSFIIFAVNSAPAKNDDVELVEVVPLEKRNRTNGFDEYDDDYPPASFIPVAYFPFNIDFRSLLTGFDEWIDRMRNRFHGLLGGEGLDSDKGNTTSTVKIVDNHKVTINDTVYKKDTPYGTQFVKVRTVYVKPLNESDYSDSDSASTTTAISEEKPDVDVRDTELLDSANDESNQMIQDKLQSQSSSSSSSKESFEMKDRTLEDDIQIFNLPSHQSIVNEGDYRPYRQPRPTFYNTNPNKRPPYPPAFPFPVNHNFNRPLYPAQPSLNEFPHPIYNTELHDEDDFESGADTGEGASEVFDLTNDIRVNQILSEQGRPFHPDAEFISVPNQPRPRPFESYPQQYPTYYFTAFRDIKKR